MCKPRLNTHISSSLDVELVSPHVINLKYSAMGS